MDSDAKPGSAATNPAPPHSGPPDAKSRFEEMAASSSSHWPDYPREAVHWLVGGNGKPLRVLELGAGTGKLTRTLCALGHDVIATDPSAAMLAKLGSNVPAAHTALARAEDVPLPPSSADVVIAAQAFHWFDQSRALPEIARVLRPGGMLALVWNAGDIKVPWVRKVFTLMHQVGEGSVDPLGQSDTFSTVEQRAFRHWQLVRKDSLVGLIGSSSYAATLNPAERSDLLAEAATLYDSYDRGSAGMRLPWQTHCLRARVSGIVAAPRKVSHEDGLLIDFT